MRIDPRVVPLQTNGRGPAARAGTGERFSLGQENSAAKAGSTRTAAPLATLDAILALQGEENPGERRRRSARRGKDILDALDGLKAALLGGRVSAAELGRVAQGLRSAGPSGDPGLDQVIGEIELRAKVELAKLGRADLI